jgi:hypothetical protein
MFDKRSSTDRLLLSQRTYRDSQQLHRSHLNMIRKKTCLCCYYCCWFPTTHLSSTSKRELCLYKGEGLDLRAKHIQYHSQPSMDPTKAPPGNQRIGLLHVARCLQWIYLYRICQAEACVRESWEAMAFCAQLAHSLDPASGCRGRDSSRRSSEHQPTRWCSKTQQYILLDNNIPQATTYKQRATGVVCASCSYCIRLACYVVSLCPCPVYFLPSTGFVW